MPGMDKTGTGRVSLLCGSAGVGLSCIGQWRDGSNVDTGGSPHWISSLSPGPEKIKKEHLSIHDGKQCVMLHKKTRL